MPTGDVAHENTELVSEQHFSAWVADKSVTLQPAEVLIVFIGGVSVRIDADELAREARNAGARSGDEGTPAPEEVGVGSSVGLSDIVDRAVQKRLEGRMPSKARDYYASIGPWVTGNSVKDTFGVSWQTLKNWREKNQLLGVEFADQKYYYPAKQFRDGRVIAGLPEVLRALAPAFVAPASRAGWLAQPAFHGEQITRWDVLREDEIAEVADWAREDAERVLAP